MTQEYNIKQELQNLYLNYPNRVIRASTDFMIMTIGRLQIENLDWEWQYDTSRVRMKTVLEYAPHDWRSPAPYDKFHGGFVVTKYGLSYRKKPLTIASYKPLWEPGTDIQTQVNIMYEKECQMKEQGAKKCEDGIEIIFGSPLWDTMHSLQTTAIDTFKKLMCEKTEMFNEAVWDGGVRVTPEIANLVKQLYNQMVK